MMMTSEKPAQPNSIPSDSWGPCPPGTLGRIAAERPGQDGSDWLLRGIGATAVVLFVLAVGYIFVNRFGPVPEYRYGGITCTKVRQMMPAFAAGDLDEQTADKIRKHLDLCVYCEDAYRRMLQRQVARRRTSQPVARRLESAPSGSRTPLSVLRSIYAACARVAVKRVASGPR